jgi:hypothetical protein
MYGLDLPQSSSNGLIAREVLIHVSFQKKKNL